MIAPGVGRVARAPEPEGGGSRGALGAPIFLGERASPVTVREGGTMERHKAKSEGGAAKPRKANAALEQKVTPDEQLAAVVGADALPRPQVVKKLWDYIKAEGLQDPNNRRMINADEKLKPIFEGRDQVSMFEMTKFVSKHLN
jgi:chromatin remodeling complex protein RSC6